MPETNLGWLSAGQKAQILKGQEDRGRTKTNTFMRMWCILQVPVPAKVNRALRQHFSTADTLNPQPFVE